MESDSAPVGDVENLSLAGLLVCRVTTTVVSVLALSCTQVLVCRFFPMVKLASQGKIPTAWISAFTDEPDAGAVNGAGAPTEIDAWPTRLAAVNVAFALVIPPVKATDGETEPIESGALVNGTLTENCPRIGWASAKLAVASRRAAKTVNWLDAFVNVV